MATGLHVINNIKTFQSCVYGNKLENLFLVGDVWHASMCLELFHAGLFGPKSRSHSEILSIFFLITNYYSRMSWVYRLESKDQSFKMFKQFKVLVKKQSGLFIKTLRTDKR